MRRCPKFGFESTAGIALFAIVLLTPGARPQATVPTGSDTPAADRSFYFGQPVSDPEDFSGVWEAPDGRGGSVGIHMQLITTISGDAVPPEWIPQAWQHLGVSVFQRNGTELAFGDENYFADEPRGGAVTLENGQLRLHFVSSRAQIPSVDLDLSRQPDGCWHGRFHRGSFDSVATLCRPTPGRDLTPDPLAGTWSTQSGSCLHIFQTGVNTYTGWTDALQIPGRIVFGPSFPKPHTLLQTYGNLVQVRRTEGAGIAVEVSAHSAICCSHPFRAELSEDGRLLRATYQPAPNQAGQEVTWTKVSGDACVDPAEIRKIRPIACPPQSK